MKSVLNFAAIAFLAMASISASAQVLVDWGSLVNLSGDSDVKTNGVVFDAANSWMNGGYTASTVNGVTFNALSNYVGGTAGQDGTDGSITWHSDGGNYNTGFSLGSAAYQNVLGHSSDANNGSITIGTTGNPLVTGQLYQVQIFAFWPGPYEAEVSGNPVIDFPYAPDQYVIGTFTATGPTEIITYGGVAGNAGHAGFVNDIVVEALPEPGTWAMLLGGAAMLVAAVRARRSLAL